MRRSSTGRRCTAAFALLLAISACVRVRVERDGVAAPPAAQLMTADRQFAADVDREGIDAWVRWFAPDGAQLIPGRVVRGHADIRALMGPLLTNPRMKLYWEPDTASVAASGDFGYTIGHSRTVRRNDDGTTTVVQTGRYLTLWRRQADGGWKVELDTGHPDPKP
jgi:ketosteroid isomerase-like protein